MQKFLKTTIATLAILTMAACAPDPKGAGELVKKRLAGQQRPSSTACFDAVLPGGSKACQEAINNTTPEGVVWRVADVKDGMITKVHDPILEKTNSGQEMLQTAIAAGTGPLVGGGIGMIRDSKARKHCEENGCPGDGDTFVIQGGSGGTAHAAADVNNYEEEHIDIDIANGGNCGTAPCHKPRKMY